MLPLSLSNNAYFLIEGSIRTADMLLDAGEPLQALRWVESGAPVVARSSPILRQYREQLVAKLPHAFSLEAFKEHYRKYASSAPGHGPGKDLGVLATQRAMALKEYLTATQPKRLLELGCGDGTITEMILGTVPGSTVVVADLSDTTALRSYFEEKYPGRVTFHAVEKDLYDWPRSQSFDLIVAMEILEHVPSPEQFLAQLPRGKVFLTTPEAGFWVERGYSEIHPENPDHLTAQTPVSLGNLALSVGLVPKDLFVTPDGTTIVMVADRNQ